MLSQNGPMSHTVRDAALLLQVLAGHDARDPTSLHETPPNFEDAVTKSDLRGLRIAWSADLGYAVVDPEVKATAEGAAQVFVELGAEVESAHPEIDGEELHQVYRTIWYADHAADLGSLLDGYREVLTPYFRQSLEQAVHLEASQYVKALRAREWHRYRMDDFFRNYDLLLTPTMAVTAFPIERFPSEIGGRKVDPSWGFSPFTFPFNISGNPAASVPCGFSSEGLPIGLHIIGGREDEVTVLKASAAFEAARPWDRRRPKLASTS
jgi:aspartyl-tRNA(Asn)/glutamyl-tRNA(Gln) amidotransferase subunit A